ncbi:TPA: ead/Ea22-like family protein, partial [Klebsiella quasipneumoniae]
QSLKSAAENATLGLWYVDPDFDVCDEDRDFIAELHGGNLENNARFIALANPANILALVEALEKAQQVDEELCKLLPPGVEYMDPPDGGDVEPIEQVRRMVADYRQRIADLESRTVTFKLPFTPEPSAFAPWAAKAFYQFHKDTVKSCVAVFSDACAAAGIKVEAE